MDSKVIVNSNDVTYNSVYMKYLLYFDYDFWLKLL